MNRAGYVLVGGRSSRMGRDKAFLPLGPDKPGSSLGGSVAAAVAAAAGSATLVGDPERYGALGYGAIPDLFPGEGPLGGILTALTHSQAEWNLITACDMPKLTAAFLESLLETAEKADADILLPVGPSGRPEVLCAIYRKRSLGPLQLAFGEGTRKVALAARRPELRTVLLPVTEVSIFQNVNTPEEWAAHGAK